MGGNELTRSCTCVRACPFGAIAAARAVSVRNCLLRVARQQPPASMREHRRCTAVLASGCMSRAFRQRHCIRQSQHRHLRLQARVVCIGTRRFTPRVWLSAQALDNSRDPQCCPRIAPRAGTMPEYRIPSAPSLVTPALAAHFVVFCQQALVVAMPRRFVTQRCTRSRQKHLHKFPQYTSPRPGQRRPQRGVQCKAHDVEATHERETVDLTVDGKRLQCDVDVAAGQRVYTVLLGKPMGLVLVGAQIPAAGKGHSTPSHRPWRCCSVQPHPLWQEHACYRLGVLFDCSIRYQRADRLHCACNDLQSAWLSRIYSDRAAKAQQACGPRMQSRASA